MNKGSLEAVTGEVRKLLEAGSCCKEAKDAAQAWLDAVGTDKESEQAKSWSPSWKRTSCQLMD